MFFNDVMKILARHEDPSIVWREEKPSTKDLIDAVAKTLQRAFKQIARVGIVTYAEDTLVVFERRGRERLFELTFKADYETGGIILTYKEKSELLLDRKEFLERILRIIKEDDLLQTFLPYDDDQIILLDDIDQEVRWVGYGEKATNSTLYYCEGSTIEDVFRNETELFIAMGDGINVRIFDAEANPAVLRMETAPEEWIGKIIKSIQIGPTEHTNLKQQDVVALQAAHNANDPVIAFGAVPGAAPLPLHLHNYGETRVIVRIDLEEGSHDFVFGKLCAENAQATISIRAASIKL